MASATASRISLQLHFQQPTLRQQARTVVVAEIVAEVVLTVVLAGTIRSNLKKIAIFVPVPDFRNRFFV